MAPNYTRIVITSVPGSDFDETTNAFYVEELQKRLSAVHRIRTEVFPIRDLIYKFAKQEHVAIDPTKIHNFSSDKKIRLLRQLAFVELDRQLIASDSTNPWDVALITTRATSFSAHGKEETLRRRYLQSIKPDLLVVIIDDPAAMFDRIPKHPSTRKYGRLEPDDLILWMENEVSSMQELAQELDCRLFVMPRRQVGALAELIATGKKPAYVSYAMTGASEGSKRKKDQFVQLLQNHFVVFDPECMGSAHTRTFMTNEQQGAYRDDVILRDEGWFVDINSEFVIVYLPEKTPAHGSQSELHTGSEECKTVYVVLEPGYTDSRGRLTPFIDRRARVVFISSEEFSYFLDLTEGEQSVFAEIRSIMWSFKRNGRLAELVRPSITSAVMTEAELFKEFVQECTRDCSRLIVRGVLEEVSESKILEMSKACWDFNRSLWSTQFEETRHQALPFGNEPQRTLKKAARRVRLNNSDGEDQRISTPVHIGLSNRQVFYALFEEQAFSDTGKSLFDILQKFFSEEGLGDFESNLDFLKSLKSYSIEDLLHVDLRACLRKYYEDRGAVA